MQEACTNVSLSNRAKGLRAFGSPMFDRVVAKWLAEWQTVNTPAQGQAEASCAIICSTVAYHYESDWSLFNDLDDPMVLLMTFTTVWLLVSSFFLVLSVAMLLWHCCFLFHQMIREWLHDNSTRLTRRRIPCSARSWPERRMILVPWRELINCRRSTLHNE
jgi:hypothetical protein